MDPPLQDKVAFFDSLEALQDSDDEYLSHEEESHRAKSKAFAEASRNKTTSQPSRTITSDSQALSDLSSNTNSARPGEADAEPITMSETKQPVEAVVIKDTPEPQKRGRGRPRKTKASASPDVLIPDTAKQPGQKPTHPLSRSFMSMSSSDAGEDSPSVKPKKRKREPKINMMPAAQQWFKGLAFFYIRDDDFNQRRKMRIVKAREYGAIKVERLEEATHVIVDKDITFQDVEPILAAAPGGRDKIVVNEKYPVDCITYRAVLNPDQSQYWVPGMKASGSESQQASTAPSQPETAESSVQLEESQEKPKEDDQALQQSASQRSVDTSQGLQPVPHQLASPSEPETQGANPGSPGDSQAKPASSPQEISSQPSDELSEIIGFVHDNFKDVSLPDDDDGEEEAQAESDGDGSEDEEERYRKKQRSSKEKPKQKNLSWQDSFSCMKGGVQGAAADNPNARTIEVLQAMCDYYSRTDDQWRIYAYRKAISTLRRQKHRVATFDEALALPQIGERLARKIEEIVVTDRLRRLQYAEEDPMTPVLDRFLKVYGAGLSQANKWIAQGFRTLDDLRQKAKLTKNQRIGLEHYDDLNTRIPRREVEALAEVVKKCAADIDPQVELIVGGSYRRGAQSCGDIDFIITKKGTRASDDLIPFHDQLVEKLEEIGFLTVILASLHSTAGGSKSHGCCVLPESARPAGEAREDDYRPVWRRIDLLLVPETEIGAALVYFTGNDIFNRSMRLLASKKSMRLNQRGLYKDVIRGANRVKLTEGELVEGRDERKIFEILGVKWREPHERWC